MLISDKNGVLTEVSKFTTKDGSEMISFTYSQGNEKELKKSFINNKHPLFNDVSLLMDDLVGKKIRISIEILN